MANILIVDDEPDVLNALARAMRLAGHNVTPMSDASEAINASREHAFDIVVLDYIMPTMSGIALLNEVRTLQPTIRSIIVSGKIDSAISEESVIAELRESIEADSYLHKPLQNAKLLEAIQQLLSEGDRDWKHVAERNLTAKKKGADVKKAEKKMSQHRRSKPK